VKPYYSDDKVTLFHGDCREITEWLEADILVTDPPYGVSHASNWVGPFQGSAIANDGDPSARDDALTLWSGRPAVVFGSWKQPRPAGTRALLTWDKGPAAGMGDLALPWKPNTEEVYILGTGFTGSRDSSVLRYSVVTWASKGRQHPNMKPTSLMSDLIQKCPPGVIADPFAGSGSTLVAAKALGRRSIGVELDEAYCEIAARRLAQGAFDFGEAS
jgi:DNA modification methylase